MLLILFSSTHKDRCVIGWKVDLLLRVIHLSAEFIQKHTQTTKLKIQFIRFELNQINCFVQNFLMETSSLLFLLLRHGNHFSKLFCSNIVRTKLAYMWPFSRENRRKFVIKNHVTRSHLSHSYINIGNYRLISLRSSDWRGPHLERKF